MDLSINQRVNEYLEHKKISQVAFGKTINVARKHQISNWMNCREKIPDKVIIEIIIKFPDINHRWLLLGDGEMLNESDETTSSFLIKNNKIDSFFDELANLEKSIQKIKTTMKILHID